MLFLQLILKHQKCWFSCLFLVIFVYRFEDNTVVILFNGQKSLNQENDVVCVSENETHRLQAVTKPQFAYNPTRECKFGSFIIICNVVPTLKTFYLTKNIGNKQLAKVGLKFCFGKF